MYRHNTLITLNLIQNSNLVNEKLMRIIKFKRDINVLIKIYNECNIIRKKSIQLVYLNLQ